MDFGFAAFAEVPFCGTELILFQHVCMPPHLLISCY